MAQGLAGTIASPDGRGSAVCNDAGVLPPLLRPGRNVWRVERARRAAVLIDGAAFFRAVREALSQAQRSVLIVGWDIDSRCRLVGEDCHPDDGMPVPFAEFLSALVSKRPELTIRLLLWDYSVVYALERELFPTLALHWGTPRQVQLCLDDHLPVGSSHHQKIIVIDDAVAFSGGLDLTIRRWDTPDHVLDNPDRVDPSGKPYRPFHDVQAMVDGDAARALGELARARWALASCESAPPVEPVGAPWPESVEPDFRDIDVGISRTIPRFENQAEVREVEALFHDMIADARHTIYIENQFLTCTKIADSLVLALSTRKDLEVLIIGPQNYHSWIEAQAMRNGRIRFMDLIRQAGVSERVRLVYPDVRSGEKASDTMIHSKILVVDDRFLRVGSANLNNRSMGADTECDLVLAAATPEHRAAIRRIRNTLIGEHCGVEHVTIARALAGAGSLVRTAEEISSRGHSLRPVEDGTPSAPEIAAAISEIADPSRPLPMELVDDIRESWFANIHIGTMGKIAIGVLLLLSLPLAWQYTPLATIANPDTVRAGLAHIIGSPWALFVVVAIFVVGGLTAFPVTVLIAVTAASFGPLLGFAYAAAGALASAVTTFSIGAWLGKDMLHDLLGPRLDRIRRRIVDQGVISVAAIRLVPIAPFTLVNLVAGASQIRLQDYLVGTILGLAPGLLVMSALGHQVSEIIARPTSGNVALLGAAIIAWIAISAGVQMLVSRLRRQ